MPVIINGTTGISGVDGSAGTPAFQGSDTNTGIRFGTDIVSLVTGGSDRLYIDSSGRLGVGTSSPVSGAQLTVAGSALAITGQNLDHSANSIRIGEEGSGAAQIRCYGPNGSTNGSLTFRMSRSDGSNSQDIVIDSSGRLGVGTTSPAAPLTVVEQGTSGAPVFRYIGNSGNGNYMRGAWFASDNTTQLAQISVDGTVAMYLGTISSTPLIITTNNTERARINSDGMFQIGATGFAKSTSGGLAVSSTVGTGQGAANSGSIAYFNETNSGNGAGLWIGAYTNQTTAVIGSTTATGNIAFQTYNGSWGERMRLTYDGKFLVGTTSSSGNLSVQGNESDPIARFSGITGGIANYSLDIKQSIGSTINFVQRWFTSSQQETTVMSFGSGGLFSTAVYNSVVGGTNRDVYVDNAGLIGYVSSTRNSKININNLATVNWLYKLNPVSFNRRKLNEQKIYTDEFYSEVEFGLIAEEAEQVAPELCFYDNVNGQQELRGVHYTKLITPMLKALQQANQRIETLESEVAALKAA